MSVDATYPKVRRNHRIVSVAVIVAVRVMRMDKARFWAWTSARRPGSPPSRGRLFWTEFLRKLRRRGLRGVKLVISDAHEGIKAAWRSE